MAMAMGISLPLPLNSCLAATPLVLYLGAQVAGGGGRGWAGCTGPQWNVPAFLLCRWVARFFYTVA